MINLLPYNEKKRIDRVRRLRSTAVILWSSILGISIVCLLLLPSMTIITTRYTLAQNEINRLENAGALVTPEALTALQSRARLVESQFVEKTTISPTEAIILVQSVAPQGVTLFGFTYEQGIDQKVTLSGVVTTREVLTKYVELLQANTRIAMVDSPISNYLKQRDNEITLIVTFK